VFERTLGPQHYELAVTFNNLAAIAQRRGNLTKAEAHYRRALTIKQRLLHDDHPDIAVTRNNLGTIHLAQGQPEQARALICLRAADLWFASDLTPLVFERVLESDHPTLAACRENYAVCGSTPRR
jgi:hypothetical protein